MASGVSVLLQPAVKSHLSTFRIIRLNDGRQVVGHRGSINIREALMIDASNSLVCQLHRSSIRSAPGVAVIRSNFELSARPTVVPVIVECCPPDGGQEMAPL